MTRYRWTPTHLALGAGFDAACGIVGLNHRAIKFTRIVARTTCGHCRRWIARQAREAAAR